jgi:LAO/AO transport system kinase
LGLIDSALAGDTRALSRLLTIVENRGDPGREAIDRLYPRTGRAHRIGITGPPGAGKSSLISRLIESFRERGDRVAVVAVDPSSRLSGGATLGDRIRLLSHYRDPNVFVRSMASRGQRGGISAATIDLAHVFDAAGFDPVLIETLGVGQDEIDVTRVVDTSILVQVPGLGDAVQTLKAGIMEVGDLIAVNKADLPGANALVRDLRAMLAISQRSEDRWHPHVVALSAETGTGIPKLMEAIQKRTAFLDQDGRRRDLRRNIARAEIELLVRADLERRLATDDNGRHAQLIQDVADRRISANAAAARLVN